MTHANAPLTVLGRQRAVTQVVAAGRPVAHVAAEFHIARSTLSKWVARYRQCGVAGLRGSRGDTKRRATAPKGSFRGSQPKHTAFHATPGQR